MTGLKLLTITNAITIKFTTEESAHTCFARLDIFNYQYRKENGLILDNDEYAQYLVYEMPKSNAITIGGGCRIIKSYYEKYMKYKYKYMKLK